jgi:Tfp pilus assembly protein PilF
MEGEVRMTVSDYANAITVYEKLVEAAPKVPAYRMRLAVAMACYPRTAKHAEREFVEAMRLDPDNGDYHYQFGLYFKAMKVKSRAVAEMRTAVRLSPRHQAAREELQSMSPRDSVLSSLRNLFK